MTTNFKTNNTAVETAYCSYDYVHYSNLWGWGYNAYSQLGDGTTTNRSSPVQAPGAGLWDSASVGSLQTMAIKRDGTLWGWGYNSYGALGLGDTATRTSPVQVGALRDWAIVSLGGDNPGFSMGIKTDGTLWAIGGSGKTGQLGTGTGYNGYYISSPVQVGALTTWSKISAGAIGQQSGSVGAIKTDGTLWTWGDNTYGQLGQNHITNRSSPVQVGTQTNWSSISSSGWSMYAIKTDGTLWAWGYNGHGELGDGTTTNRSSPVQVGALTNWSLVSAGSYLGYSACAIKTDGTLWSWGYNGLGQLGDGTTTSRSSPVQVGTLTNWSKVAICGYYGSAIAIKTDGTLWAWGYNNYGQLGQNDTVDRSSPVQVGALTAWSQVFAGAYDAFALQNQVVP
jgi:alpha-tubulin suppressor-like RCC1 family protein